MEAIRNCVNYVEIDIATVTCLSTEIGEWTMSPEEIEQVREHPRDRVNQAEQWQADGFPSTAFVGYRDDINGRRCTIRPYECLDLDPVRRKQAQGIRFLLTWDELPEEASYVDVLLAMDVKTNERIGKGPWVKVKAVDLTEGSKVNPAKDIIAPYVELEDCDSEQPIDEFFKKWLRRAFSNEKKEKILKFVYPAPTH